MWLAHHTGWERTTTMNERWGKEKEDKRSVIMVRVDTVPNTHKFFFTFDRKDTFFYVLGGIHNEIHSWPFLSLFFL